MNPLRLTRLVLALTTLSFAVLPQCAPAQAPGAMEMRLPPGAPPPTAAQKQKYIALNAQFSRDILALKNNHSLTLAQKQAQGQQLALALNKNMLAMLTPAQRAVVLKQRSNIVQLRKAFLQQHQAEIAQAKALGQQFQKSLTATEKQKITAIQQQAQAQIQKLQANPKMSLPVKQQTAGAIYRDMQRQSFAVLTPAQRSEFTQGQAIQVRLQQELIAYAKSHGQQ